VKLCLLALLIGAPALLAAENSMVLLPVRIPLDGFVREAERWIPLQFQSEWQALEKSAFGQSLKAPLATRFSVRRLPIEWHTLDDHLEMRMPVVYRVELGVPRLERRSAASVGMGWKQISFCEPAGGVVLKVTTRLQLLPTWAIDSRSQPSLEMPTPCRLRALKESLSLDITPQVRQVFIASLDKAAIELDRQIATRADLRRLAKTLWTRLHEPISVGEKVWLALNPKSVSIERPRLVNGEVRTGLLLLGQPRLNGAKDSLTVVSSLPPLITTDPSSVPLFHLDLDLDVPWSDLNVRLKEAMAGKVFKTAGQRKLHLTQVSVAPNADRLVLEANVEGSFKGHIALSGRPIIRDGILSFEDLRYTLATDSMLVRFANWLRQDLYRRQFTAMAQVNLVDLLTAQRQRIEESMRTGWTGELRLDGQIDRLESAELELTTESLRLRARATGQVTVVVVQ